MEQHIIKLSERVTESKGITPDEAAPILEEELAHFQTGDTVVLDFQGIDMMTTAFLNVLIGNLYRKYTSEQLKAMLSFRNCDKMTMLRIKKVTDTAKLFYTDQQSFSKRVEEVINGKD